MITVTLSAPSTLALAGGYEHKDAIKALEGATWDKRRKVWTIPASSSPLLLRLPCAVEPDAAQAIEDARQRAIAFNLAGIRSMPRRSPCVDEWCERKGVV